MKFREKNSEVSKVVRNAYGKIAKGDLSGCGCGCSCSSDSKEFAELLGYTGNELSVIPDEANLALSCGNPTSIAALKQGEVVLDLGSGAGFDCFLAAARVGNTGRVIGVDMTPEMLEKARSIAECDNINNVEFRLGEIENLPVADNSVDVVISNCVINLSQDKERVFREIYRVLKQGGRIAVSDMALTRELPESVKDCVEAYVGCVAGAVLIEKYRELAEAAGFRDVYLDVKQYPGFSSLSEGSPVEKAIAEALESGMTLGDYVVSVYLKAMKPHEISE
ncbi:arsenite methyltransferase [Phosphitispora sp. TUW77]|uniref:arsenite methyltransferase n=1 Tax=Phosphitispora sp. TUW77 TaxID=3152361 RepID=UPI003AB1722B